MRIHAIPVLLFCLLCLDAGADAAVTYRWIDAQGKAHYSEAPPAGMAAQEIKLPSSVEVAAAQPEVVEEQPAMAAEAAQATAVSTVSSMQPEAAIPPPQVEIYMTSWCPYCRKAEAWFRDRGIPFIAYDVEKDSAAAQRKAQLCRSRGVPLVMICGQAIPGFSEKAFEEALDDCTDSGEQP